MTFQKWPTNEPGQFVTDLDWNALIDYINALAKQPQQMPYSYTVYYDLSAHLYKAINSATGNIDYSDASLANVLNDCMAASWLPGTGSNGCSIFIRKSCATLASSVLLLSNCQLIFEPGSLITWAGSGTTGIFYSITNPLISCVVDGLNLDCNNVAGASPFVLDSNQKSTFKNLLIKNVPNEPVFQIKATIMGNNTYGTLFTNIQLYNVYAGFTWKGTASGTEITLCKMQNIWMEKVHYKGIAFQGWASSLTGDTIWISLDTAGAVGVVWNDSSSPTLNMSDYDNNFTNLWIDALLGTANDPSTVLLKFNCTKTDIIRGFYHSPTTQTFLGTQIATIPQTVSYYVEDVESGPAEKASAQDIYPRVYALNYQNGPLIADIMVLEGTSPNGSAYLSINDLQRPFDSQIFLKTSASTATISLSNGDQDFRMDVPADFLVKLLPTHKLSVRNPDLTEQAYIDASGNFGLLGAIFANGQIEGGYFRPSANYLAGDGTPATTLDVSVSAGTGTVILHFKNGLLTGTN